MHGFDLRGTARLNSQKLESADRLQIRGAPCDSNWKQTTLEWRQSWSHWREQSSCYTMTLQQNCVNNPALQGAFQVQVIDDVVVAMPKDVFIPTIDELFITIYKECIDGCPSHGAQYCRVSYASTDEGSYVKNLDLRYRTKSGRDECSYRVSHIDFCESGGSTSARIQ